MGRRKKTNEFIAEAKKVHGHKYGYGDVIYIASNAKVEITCLTHGNFEQQADNHLRGQGCPKCKFDAHRSNTEEFIKKATSKDVHGDKYGYGDVIYIAADKKVKITCLTHGDFEQIACNHLRGQGCPKCAIKSAADAQRKTTEDFIAESKARHWPKEYGHDNVIYINNKSKVIITCLTHGDFLQRADRHLQGDGCPKCNNSKGEQLVSNTLTEMNLQFKQQFKSKNCKNILKLPFDFCVRIKNVNDKKDVKGFLIEYQGEQHYKPVKRGKKMSDEKAEEIFHGIKARDEMKRVYARKNNIPLLIISYEQKDIIDKLLANFIYDTFGLKHNM